MASGTPTRYGKYEVLGPLASGGMADLYLARARGLHGFETLAVVKRIRPHLAASPEFVGLFLDEARLAAQLRHPNVVHVYDAGQEDGEYFFVMEYVHGRDVRAVLDVAARRKRPLGYDEALSIALGVAAGLHHAHERLDGAGRPLGIVHRDVSPSNILCDFEGAVKLADFGIAKATQSVKRGQVDSTSLRGKLAYLSPEQCLGLPLDRRSDIYALAVVLYELTTGSRPHGEAPTEFLALKQTLEAPVRPPSQLRPDYPRQLERIVLRGLERDRERRQASARELQLELEAFARQQQLAVSPVTLAKMMEELFANALHAWQAAQSLGKPLLQHLTESRTLSLRAGQPLRAQWDGGSDDTDEDERRPTTPLRVVEDTTPAPGVSESAPTLDVDPVGSARRRGRRMVLASVLLAGAGAIAFVVTVRHAPGAAVDTRAVETLPAMVRTSAAIRVEPAPVDKLTASGEGSDKIAGAGEKAVDKIAGGGEKASDKIAGGGEKAVDKIAGGGEKAVDKGKANGKGHPKRIAARPHPPAAWDPEAPLLPH
jgi:serine/threonine protein kinase